MEELLKTLIIPMAVGGFLSYLIWFNLVNNRLFGCGRGRAPLYFNPIDWWVNRHNPYTPRVLKDDEIPGDPNNKGRL